jgi:hypothetical protein
MSRQVFFDPTHQVFINTDVPLMRNMLLLEGLQLWCNRMKRESGVTPRLEIDERVKDRVIYYFERTSLGPVVKMNHSTWKLMELELDKVPPDNLTLPTN